MAASSASSGSGSGRTAASAARPSGSSSRGATIARQRPSRREPRQEVAQPARRRAGPRARTWKSSAARAAAPAPGRARRASARGSFAPGASASRPRCADQTAARAPNDCGRGVAGGDRAILLGRDEVQRPASRPPRARRSPARRSRRALRVGGRADRLLERGVRRPRPCAPRARAACAGRPGARCGASTSGVAPSAMRWRRRAFTGEHLEDAGAAVVAGVAALRAALAAARDELPGVVLRVRHAERRGPRRR